jgi:hypothetical protein
MCGASPTMSARDAGRVAVVVAHPGHELMVYHWLEQNRPVYCCLTDGSGGAAASRLDSTRRLLQKLGAPSGQLFGRYSDKEVYHLLLDGRVDVFVDLVEELADFLITADVGSVAGDAAEGFNPVHDVCRFVIDGAVARVRSRTGRLLRNQDFVLDGSPDSCPEALRSRATWLRLDESALDRKFEAGFGYPELRDEVRFASQRYGKRAFAVECLRPANARLMSERFENETPAYEHYGEIRVKQGRYREIIRYRPHVLPVRMAIEKAAGGARILKPAAGSGILTWSDYRE